MLARHIFTSCQAALGDTPVVLLAGARQTGKSTLAKQLATSLRESMPFLTLDDPATLSAAKRGPDAFLQDAGTRCLIDEVQRAPDLFLPMKKRVDAERLPGRYLLTGSANVLTLPKISDSLAGRMEVQVLWPFSQGEIDGRPEGFVDAGIWGQSKILDFFSRFPLIPSMARGIRIEFAGVFETRFMSAAPF